MTSDAKATSISASEQDSPLCFGEWLKRRRQALDLTQGRLAKLVCCTVFAIRKIESGDRRPSRELAGLLARALEIPAEDQAAFIKAARGELSVERFISPSLGSQAAGSPGAATGNLPGREPGALPRALTPFIGREPELSALGQMLGDPQCALLTVVGPGGIGKTRLAIEAARLFQGRFPDGVWFVPLAPLNAPALIVPAIAGALGLRFQNPTGPQAELLRYLRDKQILLVLDNAEHLLEGVGVFPLLLKECPRVKLLVTSRERLNLLCEWVFEIQGLPVPPAELPGQPAEPLEAYSSVTLFLESARRAFPGFRRDAAGRAGAASICRLVEGLPLAIEMAATWAAALSAAEIAAEIERSLDFLRTSARDVPERHRSMQAVFDHSWQMLSAAEQQALCRLSVFRGGFERRAAEQVAGASLSILSALVNRSLVRAQLRVAASGSGASGSAVRYDLHELIRQYSAAHLLADPQACAAARQRHMACFLSLVETAGLELPGHHQLEWLDRLDQELDNLRLALEYALAEAVEPGLRMAAGLHWFWTLRGHFTEGVEWLERLLAAQAQQCAARPLDLASSAARGRALNVLAYILLWEDGNFLLPYHPGQQARTYAQESQAIFEKLGEAYRRDFGIARFLQARTASDYLACRSLFRALNDRHWTALCDERLLGLYSPEEEEFSFYLAETMSLWKEVGNVAGEGIVLRYMARSELMRGNLDRTIELSLESLACFETTGMLLYAASVHADLSTCYIIQGSYQEALRQGELMHSAVLEMGDNPLFLFDDRVNKAYIAWAQQEYGLAVQYCEEALELASDFPMEAKHFACYLLVRTAISQGKTTQARAYLQAVSWPDMLAFYGSQSPRVLFSYVQAIGVLSALEGRMRPAAALFGAQDALCRWILNFQSPPERSEYEQALAAARAALGAEDFCQAWEAGRAMTAGQVMAFAMQVLED